MNFIFYQVCFSLSEDGDKDLLAWFGKEKNPPVVYDLPKRAYSISCPEKDCPAFGERKVCYKTILLSLVSID